MKKSANNFIHLLISVFISAIAMAGAPTSSFTVSPGTTVTPGTTVCYTNTSTGSGINSWAWTFGGQAANYTGTTSGTANPPCVTYNTVGSFQTCLTVTNSNGNNQSCQTITVSNAINIGTANGTTVNNACGMLLEDSGGAGNYSNNENNTVTFCSGNTNYVNFNLSTIDLAAGDVINIYAGSGTGGTLLSAIGSGQNGTTPSVNSTSTCVTVQFVSNGSTTAGGFSMQAFCTPSNHIIMGPTQNGNIISNACGYSIFDSGYSSANYSNNENYTTTICASSASQVPQILFNSLNVTAGDQILFYDGTGTGGQLIYDVANTDNGNNSFISPGLTVTGLSQCMTVQFISNGTGVSAGFNGSISCKTPPAPCNSNPVPADNFDAATLICDFTQYCGVTSSFYGVDMPNIDQTAVFDGSFENNSWMSFIADAPTASFTVTTTSASCYIQIGIYSVNSNEGFTWLSPESINGGFDYTNIDTGFSGTGTLNAQGMIPGNTYYILVDGHGGSVCNYTLTAGIGIQLPEPQASPDVVMSCGDNESISVTDLNGSTNINWSWTWTGASSGGPQTGSTVDLSTLGPGNYTFTVDATAFSECSNVALQDEVNVIVDCPLPIELLDFFGNSNGDVNDLYWITNTEYNSSHFILERSIDVVHWKEINYQNAAGYSTTPKNYHYRDEQVENGIAYYRLTQYDYDNNYEVFPIISVARSTKEKEIISITNILGQEITIENSGIVIILYSDGTFKRVVQP